ncbi:MAG: response regulator [Burkholderiales bacterium]|nr:MAG: response regulator [Burkholderiales bacterium]
MMVVQSKVILVVEDDHSLREAIERLLRAGGFECCAFAAAEALLAAPVQGAVACIVCDLKLPGMSGLELLGELRARARKEPFILITAHDTPGLFEEASRRGVAAYLSKPFRGTQLLDAIKAATGPRATA